MQNASTKIPLLTILECLYEDQAEHQDQRCWRSEKIISELRGRVFGENQMG